MECGGCGFDESRSLGRFEWGKTWRGDTAKHYKCGSRVKKCPKCSKLTCIECGGLVDLQAQESRRRLVWGALVAAAAFALWWSPWNGGAEEAPRILNETSFSSDPCEDMYTDLYSAAYLDEDAVRDTPGCEGFLPPPPEMLPGHDQNCDDIASGPVRVGPYDRYGLDADGDGIGCELNE